MDKVCTMSEQEASRSPDSGVLDATEELTSQDQTRQHHSPDHRHSADPTTDQSCSADKTTDQRCSADQTTDQRPDLDTCLSCGMGNTIFSSPEKGGGAESEPAEGGNTKGCAKSHSGENGSVQTVFRKRGDIVNKDKLDGADKKLVTDLNDSVLEDSEDVSREASGQRDTPSACENNAMGAGEGQSAWPNNNALNNAIKSNKYEQSGDQLVISEGNIEVQTFDSHVERSTLGLEVEIPSSNETNGTEKGESSQSKAEGSARGGEERGVDVEGLGDTDSEAGESCYSEDGEAVDGCGGECNTAVDEEFNVPRNPVFNGSAEQLCRRSSLKRKASEEPEEASPAKCKRGIQFEGVTVFYFPRSQGFTCVPSQGGSTLGMARRHSHIRQFTLAEHAVEQRRAHREFLLRLRQQRSARERGDSSSRGSSSEDSEENSEEASDLSDSELDADSYYFLQPLPIRQRRALLRQAGIRHIEGVEKEECKDIRVSRELCGCQCKVYCDPDTCQCAEAGIKCQVDRHNFPCGCSREGCGNSYGRIEFNPIRVRTHFIHTLMRLEIEKRQQASQQPQQQASALQQGQWQQQQQRAKWMAGAGTNCFSGGGLASGNLPFFDGARDPGNLGVSDLHKFNSSVEMNPCVGTMNGQLYGHMESRQMLAAGASSVYLQHDNVGDYSTGTCSVFGGLASTFDTATPYGSCHSFSPSTVVAPQAVTPPVVPPQPSADSYSSISKFTGSSNLLSSSFPYSGAVTPVNSYSSNNSGAIAPVNSYSQNNSGAAAPVNSYSQNNSGIVAPVNSYSQNNFCVAGMNDIPPVFNPYHDHASATAQNLFKPSGSECNDFQPNFEAISSSSTPSDKNSSYIPAASLVGSSKELCADYAPGTEPVVAVRTAEVGAGFKVEGPAQTQCEASSVRHEPAVTSHAATTHVLPSHATTPHATPVLNFESNHLGSASKESVLTKPPDGPESAENLGDIVKKSMIETVSA